MAAMPGRRRAPQKATKRTSALAAENERLQRALEWRIEELTSRRFARRTDRLRSSWSRSTITDVGGKPQILFSGVDVTERKREREQLRASYRRR